MKKIHNNLFLIILGITINGHIYFKKIDFNCSIIICNDKILNNNNHFLITHIVKLTTINKIIVQNIIYYI